MRWPSACILGVTILVAGGCGSVRTAEKEAPADALHGGESGIHQQRVVLISDQQAFSSLWREHAGSAAMTPVVDFTRNRVVAFFHGERLNQPDLVVSDIVEETTLVTLRFSAVYRSTDVRSSFTAHPYCFTVIPRTDKTVVVEFDAKRERQAPPQWIEQARLPVAQP
jgi:hypothetical protein